MAGVSPTLEARRAQLFPVLEPEEIAHVRRFATPCRYAAGDKLFETGKPAPGLLVILSGRVRASARDGHGGEILITEYGPGGFSGEVGLLSRRPSYADGLALTDIESLCVNLDQLHALLVAEAVLGEKIMRALILRRVALLEAGAGGPVLIGAAASAGVARLRHFLSRNAVPHVLLDPANDADGRTVLERYGARTEELPLVICPDGTVLRNPTEAQVARCIGMLDGADSDRVYDLVVAGAGPAGLSVAV